MTNDRRRDQRVQSDSGPSVDVPRPEPPVRAIEEHDLTGQLGVVLWDEV